MYISEEMIREVQKRIEVSYEEAAVYLKKAKGNINHAVYLISKKRNSSWEGFKSAINDVFNSLIQYRIIITRKDRVLLDIPLMLLGVLIFIDDFYSHLFPLFVIFMLILLTECKMKIEREERKQNKTHKKHPMHENNSNSRESEFQDKATGQERQPVNYDTEIKVELKNKAEDTLIQHNNNDDDDDYYEIVVEK